MRFEMLLNMIFLVVLKCKKIQKCILPCENFNFVTKISRNKKKLFHKIRNKYFAKFREIVRQLCMRGHILYAVSTTIHAPCMRFQ
jgi:hypothetical protein